MATISRRKSGWLAQVRRKGFEPRTKTLPTKAEASAWARMIEGKMELGLLPPSETPLKTTTLGDIIDRYMAEVSPRKRSVATELQRLGKLRDAAICQLSLSDLSGVHLSAYRDLRLKTVKAGTIRRELSLIHHALDIAVKEWGLPPFPNPIKTISLPPLNNARDRRLEDGEIERLTEAIRS